ncbi:tyrosine-type recombinase/integrase [uncultured Subdoligranulum sp.]|uniref:tyrosine-type recombinase/integrase n=1 Tax=uncultured Subdoligranulum sp. TaxID=512298 RepID=UPI0025FE1356|nr:tyrosine-type recombinase/integrase [uncultured Subdoligranulum sp.]
MEEEKELACFCAYLQTRERSEGTIEKYRRDLKRYFRDVNADKWLTHEGAVQWRDALVRQGYAAVSINAMLAAVNGYFVFRQRLDCCARPLKRQRRAFCDPDRELDPQEYRCLLRTARKEKQNRLLMILQTMASTGIRVSELQHITVEAVHQGHAAVHCKGKCREIFLPRALCEKLSRWCKKQGLVSGSVFVTRSGHPIDRSNLWREMKALCKRAGIACNKVFPHNLRHLFARAFYKIEKNLSKLADLLGHSSIETTRIYIMESGREHQRLIDQMHLLL